MRHGQADEHVYTPSIWMGLLAGAIAGALGSWAMTQFHVALYGRGVTGTREPQSHRPVEGRDDAATMAADAVAVAADGRGLTPAERRSAAPLVHYAFGCSVGAMYGAAAERIRALRRGHGIGFGAAVWAVADEALLPVLGLARGPRAYPLAVHLEMLVAHLVYGAVTHHALAALRGYEAPPGRAAGTQVAGEVAGPI